MADGDGTTDYETLPQSTQRNWLTKSMQMTEINDFRFIQSATRQLHRLTPQEQEESLVAIAQFAKQKSKFVRASCYDVCVPVYKKIMKESRSETLRFAAFKAMGHIGSATQKFSDEFIEAFALFIGDNRKLIVDNPSLIYCLGCDDKMANVAIRKACNGDSCGCCSCPPCWCAGCMLRAFVGSAPSVDEQAACPTCRAGYCVKDIAYVSDEKSGDDETMEVD